MKIQYLLFIIATGRVRYSGL